MANGVVLASDLYGHWRISNRRVDTTSACTQQYQIAVFNEMRHQLHSKEFQTTLAFIRKELPDLVQNADYRRDLLLQRAPESQAIKDLANFFDEAAVPVKRGCVNLGCSGATDVQHADLAWISLVGRF